MVGFDWKVEVDRREAGGGDDRNIGEVVGVVRSDMITKREKEGIRVQSTGIGAHRTFATRTAFFGIGVGHVISSDAGVTCDPKHVDVVGG